MNYFENITKVLNIPFMQFGDDNGIITNLENIEAPTDTSKPYLASFMLNAPVETADLGLNERRSGIYQIDINYAQAKGSAPINKMADKLNAVFKKGATFTRNNICMQIDSVSLSPLLVNDGWAKRSLSIEWNCYTKRI